MVQGLGFDIETDGFYENVTKVHVLVIKNFATGERWIFRQNQKQNTIEEGLRLLMRLQSQEGIPLVAHNGIKYDVPVLRKLYPWFQVDQKLFVDTIVVTHLIYPDLWETDAKLHLKGKLPGNLKTKHSLEAWGYRLGVMKDEYMGDPAIADEKERFARRWESWNQTMEDYCVQDVEVLEALFNSLVKRKYSPQAIRLEHDVQWIIARQERYGFYFHTERAVALYAKLVKRRDELARELRERFKPFYVRNGPVFVPKKDSPKTGYVAGAPLTRVKLTEFNPASRDHIAKRLKALYGWKPTEFTEDGKPKVDETVLLGLKFPEAELLREYFLVDKRIGQVAEGSEAWLKRVGRDGRMHGAVTTNGAVTGRMTHAHPNMAQVPASHSPYGADCRSCFGVPPGKVLIGVDADALELRDLAGYMAIYDGGAYIETVLRGDKKAGTDMHSVNCRALGMDPKAPQFPGEDTSGRDVAKTWFYAFIYGAGDEKLGQILTRKKGAAARKRGAKSRADFLQNLPALGKLVKGVQYTAMDPKVAKRQLLEERDPERRALLKKARGYLRGLDGRLLHIRSIHAALNTLLQSAGAVQMKMALVICEESLQALGLRNSDQAENPDYEFVANVHDEWQIEANEELGELIGKKAVEAIPAAGEAFGFRCPLAGEYKIGRDWSETH